MIIKKEVPINNALVWSNIDRKRLKYMVNEGRKIKEIAEVLGRTPGAVMYQKSNMGLRFPISKGDDMKGVRVRKSTGKTGKVSDASVMSNRDRAKEMANFARGIARTNGKRITMAMFFVEDL